MTDRRYFQTENMSVGYSRKPLISEINIALDKGMILTLIGPNGSGKSTILKSITKHLSLISGVVYIGGENLMTMSGGETAKRISVVLTERVRPELMTCGEVVALGRYPYTNNLGRLTAEDEAIIDDSLEKVNGLELKDRDFDAISDGQRQRILLARAICQQPEIIVLDEPTSFLDIRYKVEFLEILRRMSRDEHISVIMSLHEIELAQKISDLVMCVKGDRISRFGPPEEIFTQQVIDELYGIQEGTYNLQFGSVELAKPVGEPETFVLPGCGCGIPFFRVMQRKNIPFYAGILYDNDVDYQAAKSLAAGVFTEKAFMPVSEAVFQNAADTLKKCRVVVDSGMEIREFNNHNQRLLDIARQNNKIIVNSISQLSEVFG